MMNQSIGSDSASVSVSNLLLSNSTISRPAFSWCSKCGQSMEISTESNLYKSKNNFKFRKIFDFEESEVLVKTFSCALVDDILFQGTLYASQNFFCFFSRIANKQKKVIISIEKIVKITKEKTAGIFPNAIAIRTEHNKVHLFSSFVHREIAFRCLNEVWTNRQDEKFVPNWNLGFIEGTDSKENPLLDIDVETDSMIIPTPMISKILANQDLIADDDDDEETFADINLIGSRTISSLPSCHSQFLDKKAIRDHIDTETTHNSSAMDSFVKMVLRSISKEKIQLVTAVSILIFLTLYIVILAWKIHDFQMILIERFSSSCNQLKGNLKNLECPLYDNSCKIHKESIIDHQTKMSRVLSNLKDTLNLLQNVVDISGQMFTKFRPASLSSIIEPDNKSPTGS